jgi:hypothetical protein
VRAASEVRQAGKLEHQTCELERVLVIRVQGTEVVVVRHQGRASKG